MRVGIYLYTSYIYIFTAKVEKGQVRTRKIKKARPHHPPIGGVHTTATAGGLADLGEVFCACFVDQRSKDCIDSSSIHTTVTAAGFGALGRFNACLPIYCIQLSWQRAPLRRTLRRSHPPICIYSTTTHRATGVPVSLLSEGEPIFVWSPAASSNGNPPGVRTKLHVFIMY